MEIAQYKFENYYIMTGEPQRDSNLFYTIARKTQNLSDVRSEACATEDAEEEEEKETFYDELQASVDETPSNDVLLIMGGLNAKV